ncbi:MAG: sporulation protein YtfJ [Clostridiales bacterium]|nr:sporulation protein YtfJ [Clostridiales bacterium]
MDSILLPSERKEHPIERIMDSAFGKVRTLTDADIIVGDPIITPDGMNIIPISKVSVGIVSGGGEYSDKQRDEYPFAGASGAGMSISPVCFLVSDGKSVKILTTDSKGPFDKVMETVPNVVGSLFGKRRK